MNERQSNTLLRELVTLVQSLKPVMEQNYSKIRNAYHQEYGWPEFDPLRHEISLCLLFGLSQAAITLTNHFLETLLKYVLIYHYSLLNEKKHSQVRGRAVDALEEFTAEGLRLYGTNDLGKNINAACSQGLLTKPEKEQLHEFREAFRNAYGHADKEKTFGDASVPVQAITVEDGSILGDQSKVQSVVRFPIIQGLVQAMQAERHAFPYFSYVDNLAREILNNRLGKQRPNR